MHRYRAAKSKNGSIPFDAKQWEEKLSYWGNRCWMCRAPLEDNYHRDHVKPLSKGGIDCLANLRPACPSCNTAKGARWPYQQGKHNRI
ncbi:HNH endonuclease [Mycobacterium intracellulare]|uniref:HNH endonuclease n=1 Tax=Mycobacterium intracellulare TaxID=1767 RepID=UPI00192917FD